MITQVIELFSTLSRKHSMALDVISQEAEVATLRFRYASPMFIKILTLGKFVQIYVFDESTDPPIQIDRIGGTVNSLTIGFLETRLLKISGEPSKITNPKFLRHLLPYLDAKSIGKLDCVSKEVNALLKDQAFWRDAYHARTTNFTGGLIRLRS